MPEKGDKMKGNLFEKNSSQKNALKEISLEEFKNPPREYRGMPFWSWNCKLEMEELERQIEELKEMGFGGFFMHVRTGMDTPYLSDEYMEMVRGCVEKAKAEGMRACLYDEDRWSSGAAGGLVTKEKKYRQKYLLFTPWAYGEKGGVETPGGFLSQPLRNGKGRLLARYTVMLDEEGYLGKYRILAEGEEGGENTWYAYLETAGANPWYNGQAYSDTLNKEAVERFLQVTHEKYKEWVGSDFGEAIPMVFTDEPQFARKHTLDLAEGKKDVTLPWTDDCEEGYLHKYGESLLEALPELFWELPEGKISRARYRYHDYIAERFATAFAGTYGQWCERNGLMLTGHLMEEPALESQCAAVGETMRSYGSFSLPGIDMLRRDLEYTTAKQAQSMARQHGKKGISSELYGVTGWDTDFRDYKFHGDWQAALGVVLRIPHLSWVSMKGEAKRDFPATFGYQSPWYKKFGYVEEHFARVNMAMTRGRAVVRVGVLHPIESLWLHWGPAEQTGDIRSQMDENFKKLTEWLLFGGVDFDFICESRLPEQYAKGGVPFRVGVMKYDAVIVPGCETLRKSTVERLEEFRAAGGCLIFMGKKPVLMDGMESARPGRLYESAYTIPFERHALLDGLKDFKEVEIREENGMLTGDMLYQMREETGEMGAVRWLFIARGKEPYHRDIVQKRNIRVKVRGSYTPEFLDTVSGKCGTVRCSYEKGWTVMEHVIYDYDSLLFRLNGAEEDRLGIRRPEKIIGLEEYGGTENCQRKECRCAVGALVEYVLEEPNVLVLDKAQYCLDRNAGKRGMGYECEYNPETELLQADDILRKSLGWEIRGAAAQQPWTRKKEKAGHLLHLRFTIESEIECHTVWLAMEEPQTALIVWNGSKVADKSEAGWYTDRAIRKIVLPGLKKGENILELTLSFGKDTNMEWCYLLGEFGVRVMGERKIITCMPEQVGFDDLTRQGFPFYGGSFRYRIPFRTKGGETRVRIPHYRSVVLEVGADGGDKETVAYPPYETGLGQMEAGEHMLEITAYISRHNAFGALHQADSKDEWCGPDAWRTKGDAWTESYRLAPCGLLSAPVITSIVY